MKPTTHQSSSPQGRRALLATALAILVTAGTAHAQTSGAAGSTSAGSSQKNPSSTSSTDTSSATGSSYGTGSSTYSSGTGSTSGQVSGSTTGSSATQDTTTFGTTTTESTAAGAPTGRESSTSAKLSWGDRRFVTKAADAGMAEEQLAQLAAQQATSADVKSYAQKLAEAHQKVNSELKTLAGQKNVKLDDEMDKDRAYKRLSKKTGSDFDQEFVEHMIDEHEKDIKMFEKASKDAKDADIRSFASKHVGHLREHLQKAQSLRQTLMPTGRTDDDNISTRASTTTSETSATGTSSTTGSDRSQSTSTGRDSNLDSTTSGSSSSGTTGTSSDSSSSTTPKRDGSR